MGELNLAEALFDGVLRWVGMLLPYFHSHADTLSSTLKSTQRDEKTNGRKIKLHLKCESNI